MANGNPGSGAAGISLFISYSRDDSTFIDRLDADLRARGYHTWVDRRKLEGGQDWEREIGDAIGRQALTVVALSPMAVQSHYVRFEYERALSLGKRIIPLMVKTCPFPSALGTRQWVNFTTVTDADGPAYQLAFKELVYVLQDPSFDLTADPNTLYNRALSLEATNPEQAVLLLQRTLDRDPNYFGGEAARHLQRLETRLYDARAARLEVQAKAARRRGAYGEEAGALEALLALGRRDTPAATWASEYLPIAQQNRAFVGPYEVIQQRIAAGDLASAGQQLTTLWEQAPYFGDPAGIAAKMGLTRPMTYEHVKAQKEEEQHWIAACQIVRTLFAYDRPDGAMRELKALGYDLKNQPLWALLVERSNTLRKANEVLESLEAQRQQPDYNDYYSNMLAYTALAIGIIAGLVSSIITFDGNATIVSSAILLIAGAAVLGSVLFLGRLGRQANRLAHSADELSSQFQQLYEHWQLLAEPIHRQRLEAIAERDRRGEF